MRGSPNDYDEWAELTKEHWRFEEILPFFNKLETDRDFGRQPWHGDRGPIPVDRYLDHDLTDVTAAAVSAMETQGFTSVHDHNEPGAIGVGRMPMSSRDGVRVTSADGYLPADTITANLSIKSEAHVSEVIVEGGNAAGVRLIDGTEIKASWVVLAAGVYGSPAILMRSGIGAADELRALGLGVIADLPGVGSNLGDHPCVTSSEEVYIGAARPAGPLHVIGTFHSSTSSSAGSPDLMLWFSDPTDDPPAFAIETVLLKPKARGKVWLRSADARDAPRIELPSLEPEDVERLAEGHLRAVEVANDRTVRSLCEGNESEPGRRPDLEVWVRATRYSLPHVVGTCAMGAAPEDGAVVDGVGRVHGIERLSVVDASIIPEPPSGFPHIPTIMIAERLSERLAGHLDCVRTGRRTCSIEQL